MSKFKSKDLLKTLPELRVDARADGASLLQGIDPAATPGFEKGKKDSQKDFDKELEKVLAKLNENLDARLEEAQTKLFANGRAAKDGLMADGRPAPAVLLVLQGMDTSGKGGAIRTVFAPLDPQGIDTVGFGKPTDEEKAHDFLWRIRKHDPAPGEIVAFDRSHYEDVVIHRVHGWADEAEIERRFASIRAYEEELSQRGVAVIKAFLHISTEFQKENLLERVENPEKYWKYNPGDIDERAFWDDYLRFYGEAFVRTDADHAPWYVIPNDNKKYGRTVLKALLADALEAMNLDWPPADFDIDAEKARIEAL